MQFARAAVAMIIPKIGSKDLDRTSVLNSQSLSRSESCDTRARAVDLEHISEVLARISANLDRQPMGKLSEQGGGIPSQRSPQNQEQSPLLVNTSYPLEGGASW
jgi:hypothetical protein